MLDQIIKRTYYLNKHLEAPFLKEREDYLRAYANRGICTSSLKDEASLEKQEKSIQKIA